MADEEKKQENITFDLKELEIEAPKDKKALNFKAFIKSLGLIDLDRELQTTVSTLLPKGFSSEKLTAALNLYADGYSSSDLENSVDSYVEKNPDLEEDARYSFYAEPYLVRVFEEANLKEDKDIQRQINNLLTQEQIIEYSQIPTQTSINFQLKDEVFQPVMRNVSAFVKGAAKKGFEEVRGLFGKKVKEGAGKVIGKAVTKSLKTAGKKLAKKGVSALLSLATKAGIQVAAPGVGTVVFILLSAAKKVFGFIVRTIKSLGRNIINWIRRNKEKVAAAAVAMLTVGALLGSPFLIFGGLTVGALAWTVGGVHAFIFGVWGAFILPIVTMAVGSFAAFLLMVILITAFAYLIITSGAYIVPPGGFNVAPPGSIVNPYIGVEKVAIPDKVDNPPPNRTVSYTITVTAKQGTLTNISFTYKCTVIGSGSGTPCPNPSPAIPQAPSTISPTQAFVINYQVTYDSKFADSIVTDIFTVTADAPSAPGQSAAISESVIIGNPPIDCPIPGGTISWASYIPGDETSKLHGNNAYWAGGRPCVWSLPQSISCMGPTDPAASSNVCYSQGAKCAQYGYAIDVVGSTEVLAPQVLGQSVTWNCSYAFANAGGTAGYSYRCTSGQYTLILTHMKDTTYSGTYMSGEKIGELFPWGGNTHLHIEFAINGVYQRPEDYFCR